MNNSKFFIGYMNKWFAHDDFVIMAETHCERIAEFIKDAMDALPPACMRRDCAQLGEPYSHRQDPDTGSWRPTYATFKCVSGNFREGVWEYCGNCFRGETTERGKDPVYVTGI